MGLLLLLLGVLAAGDGALALWRGARSGRSWATPAVWWETAAGAVAVAASALGLSRVRPLAWAVVALVAALVVVSLAVRLRRVLRDRGRREAFEGERLRRYLEAPRR